jgi:hypothetical protein
MKKYRHLAKFSITPEILMFMGSGKYEVVANPLPADAVMCGAFYDPERHTFTVLIESQTFASVEAGDCVPDIPSPQITHLNQ